MDKKLKRVLVWLAVYLVVAIAVPTFVGWRWVPPGEWGVGVRVIFLYGAIVAAWTAFCIG